MARSLLKLIRHTFWFSLAACLILFSVNNRQLVDVSLFPLEGDYAIPAFFLIFVGIFIGLLAAAGVTGWLRLKAFTRRRKAERRANELEGQVAALSEDEHKKNAKEAHTIVSHHH